MQDAERFSVVIEGLSQARNLLTSFIAREESVSSVARAASLIAACFRGRGRVLTCGNGGSMSDSMHVAEEFAGRFRKNREALSAISISDPTHLTCVGNDFGFDKIFSRGVEAHGRHGDVLIALSTSGKSPNVIEALHAAKKVGMTTITLTGKPGSPAAALADIDIWTIDDSISTNITDDQPGHPRTIYADRIQELHIKILHLLVELVERELFPECY
jgi:D-sedoheptulose 7-phosphate isomerase